MKPTRKQLEELKDQADMLLDEWRERRKERDLADVAVDMALKSWKDADYRLWEAFTEFYAEVKL